MKTCNEDWAGKACWPRSSEAKVKGLPTPFSVQFSNVIYVLHTFQKKSKSGIATTQKDIELIRRRLAEAQRLNRQRSN